MYHIRTSTIDSLDSSVTVVRSLGKQHTSGIGFESLLARRFISSLQRPVRSGAHPPA